MPTPVMLRQILPKFQELRKAGKVVVQREGDQLKIVAKRYAEDTGEEIEPLVLTPTKDGLEQHKSQLEEEISLVNRVLDEFGK